MPLKEVPFVRSPNRILAHAKEYIEDPLTLLRTSADSHGGIFRMRAAHQYQTIVNKPEYIQHVLLTNRENYRRHFSYRVLKTLFGDGIITIDGEHWRRERDLMQPFFNREHLRAYFPKVDKIAKSLVTRWDDDPDNNYLLEDMGELTLKVIASCFLGGDIGDRARTVQENLPDAMEVMIKRMYSIPIPMWVPTARHRHFRHCLANLERLVADVIKEKEQTSGADDLLSTYLAMSEDGETSSQQIFDEVITILSAGHESTANAMFVLIQNVFEQDGIRSRLIDELDAAVGSGDLQYEHLGQLPYTDKVLKEAARLATPAWAFAREAIDDDVIDGYRIKAGESVIVSPYLMHRTPDYWPAPDSFNPNRFDRPPDHKFAYIPFGGGPMLCVGMGLALMEMKVMLHHMLRSNHRPAPDAPLFEDTVFNTISLTLRPEQDVQILRTG